MWTNFLNEANSTAIKIVYKYPDTASRIFEFVIVLESIKYIDFLKLDESARLIDVIDKLKFLGVSQHYIDELNTYRYMRNAVCHNKDAFTKVIKDLDYFTEHAQLVNNIINLIIKDIEEKGIDVDSMESKYQEYLKQKRKEREEKLKKKLCKGLTKSSLFTTNK